jgi:starch phosphorylase
MNNYSQEQLELNITGKLSRYFGTSLNEASPEQVYKAVVMTVKDILLEKRKVFSQKQRQQKKKKLYYLCMEFLVGKSLRNNCYNLNIIKQLDAILKEHGIKLEDLYELESDAGLGNGGLGRLAACFLDSLATQGYVATGFTILYEYGLFKQKIVEGWQTELPDPWLLSGETWLTQRIDRRFPVRFGGSTEEKWTEKKLEIYHHGYTEVEAVPYDMMISGADGEGVSALRLWKPVAAKSFDFQSFSQGDYASAMKGENEAELIGKVLYPADITWEGKALRLKQQYFFVSASLQNIIYDHIHRIGAIETLPEFAAIHLNDTHPALAVPELMRLLMDEQGLSWEKAWEITVKTTAYTNHTVLPEALEVWDYELIQRYLPRLCSIIKEIDKRHMESLSGRACNLRNLSIIENNAVKMANLCVIGSHAVNGVSQLHSEIIKKSVFKNFYEITPDKFLNVTNGITQRRWLNQGNRELSALIYELLGDDCHNQPQKLEELKKFADNTEVLKRLEQIKYFNKKRFSDYAHKRGMAVDPDTVFDVQAKRIHEYKRQLLNALKIISIYDDLLANPNCRIQPATFIFAGKAAPGYFMAKQIIKLIWCLSQEIKKNKKINEILNVEFMEDYNVSAAEILIPAAEVSQQISLAGKEASGTGNMKFMLNGALTIGTLDGANVEMAKACGIENIYIFGLKSGEVEELWKAGYNSTFYYNKSERLKRVFSMLKSGFNGVSFYDISQYLLTGKGIADPYMCLADFSEYFSTHQKVYEDYTDKVKWNRMSLNNIAAAGAFSCDISIQKYARDIWKMFPIS